MKTNCWLILAIMLATSAVAQVNTNKLPEIPPPAIPAPSAPASPVTAPMQVDYMVTNAPVKKAVKTHKKSVKKKARAVVRKVEKKAPEMPVTLVAGPATVDAEHVNLRGQAGLKGEVVGHVQKGDTVTVISEITLDKPKAGEPAQWAKIALPTGTKVWLDAKYVDASNNVVTAKKLNLRGGPGENYSVLGVVEKGTAITQVTTKGDWMQIEPPASAFAFVDASYLKQEGSMLDTNLPVQPAVAATEAVPPPTPAPVPVPPTPTTVAEAQPITPPAATPPATPDTTTPPAATPPPVATESTPTPPPATQETTPTPATPVTPEATLPQPTLEPDDTNLPPPPPRIVTHEGTVRHSVSLVAPTYFELYDPSDNKAINYLYSPTTNLNLSRYNGLHITVTGEEGLDPRWQDTPVITIQKIYVLSGALPVDAPVLKPVKKTWW